MKAAILETLNRPLVVANVGLTPLRFGQVLVKNIVTGICGAQLEEIKGNKGNGSFVPHLLGHEACGLVEDVGDGVQKVKKRRQGLSALAKGGGNRIRFP